MATSVSVWKNAAVIYKKTAGAHQLRCHLASPARLLLTILGTENQTCRSQYKQILPRRVDDTCVETCWIYE